jgi:hypothetical protein
MLAALRASPINPKENKKKKGKKKEKRKPLFQGGVDWDVKVFGKNTTSLQTTIQFIKNGGMRWRFIFKNTF